MKTIYFIRHAKSSWEFSELKDFDRPLNPRGLRDGPFMAKLLKGKGVEPDLLISSTAKRAFATATFFIEAFKLPETKIRKEKKVYEAFSDDILNIIYNLEEDISTVLLFGHNPAMTNLANTFSNDYIPNVPTCGIVEVSSTAETWKAFSRSNTELTNFYYPKQYFT